MRVVVRSRLRVPAPAGAVFDYVTDWPRQGEWIPLTRVETAPGEDSASRVGGRIRAWTGLGPFGFWDPMTITTWERGDDGSGRCEMLHRGAVVRGEAEFAVSPDGPAASTVVWWERVELPGGALGHLLWRVGGRAVQRGLDRVLRRMADRVESVESGRHG